MSKQVLIQGLINIGFNIDDFVVVCIGTNKSFLDSVGPRVGTELFNNIPNIIVYGTMDDNCHALSLGSKFKEIAELYPNKKVLAIDACCTRHPEKVGTIELLKGAIEPGAGVGKKLPSIGDFSIKAFTLDMASQDLIHDVFLKASCKQKIYMQHVKNSVDIISSAIIEVNKLNNQGGILYE